MKHSSPARGSSLSLLTDLYQLTMAQGYYASGRAQVEASFALFFRKAPFRGGFTIACGLEQAIEYLEAFRFDASDLDYLAGLRGGDGQALFGADFLDHLGGLQLHCDVHAVPEGSVVFPHEPLVRVTGPLIEAQLVETALLNIVNFQTLIATKAARICLAARGEPVLEFGLRRAQGIDGGLTASRAAFVGGAAATSNVLAGKLYGIPVKGTHAHSWVMSFDDELAAFRSYAQAMPNNCVFLVDTFDTLEGVRRAITVGRELRQRGHEMVGVRLDSGDLTFLSREARRLLDEAGFAGASIVASNDLDEHLIEDLKHQGACVNVWGVGTRLATAYDQPALGGVYKMTAIRDENGVFRPRVKLSEQVIKTSNPGLLQVRRFENDEVLVADAIFDELAPPESPVTIVDPLDPTRRRTLPSDLDTRDLLVPIFDRGRRVYEAPPLETVRSHASQQLDRLHAGHKRFRNPHQYPVGLEAGLFDRKTQLVLEARGS